MSQIEEDLSKQIIKQHKGGEKNAKTNLGRYQGYVLIHGDLAKRIEKFGYRKVKSNMYSLGYKMLRWESLSYDDDDNGEFGVKKN